MKNLYDAINVTDQLWTMRGNKPVKLIVIDKFKCKKLIGGMHYKIWLVDRIKNQAYDRTPDKLFKTYEDLKNHVFPPLN